MRQRVACTAPAADGKLSTEPRRATIDNGRPSWVLIQTDRFRKAGDQ